MCDFVQSFGAYNYTFVLPHKNTQIHKYTKNTKNHYNHTNSLSIQNNEFKIFYEIYVYGWCDLSVG